MMYGKHFGSMYEGSMYGAGPTAFAVWGYVIAFTKNSRIELNPKKLADTIGCKEEEIQKAIAYHCKPDPGSRNQAREGRRLVKEGAFQYFVTGWEEYQKIRNEEERREYNRNAKRAERERLKVFLHQQKFLNGEAGAVAAVQDGRISQEEADARASESRERK